LERIDLVADDAGYWHIRVCRLHSKNTSSTIKLWMSEIMRFPELRRLLESRHERACFTA
jgi:hypothetical protein